MSTTRTYSPLPPMIPAGDIFCANPRVLQEPDPCPHTYGVRVGMCAAVATEPCRPTACIPAAPFRHTPYRFRPRQTTTVWRNLPQHQRTPSSHTFSAKEKDSETGFSYFGSRYYSSDLSIWLSVDPMSDKYPSLSPYVYCADNPVKLVDPNGEEISPIYDTYGNFLGTDDEGLTGKAIVMKKENFKQGMSHKDALSNNLGSKGLVDEDAHKKLLEHYSGLKERPDYDGYLTKAEADAWWRGKSGQPLYVDQSKIELPGITTQSFVDEGKNYIYKNFIVNLNNTGKVYGTLKLTLINEKTGEVHIGGPNYMDKYDFKMDGRRFRDFATRVGRPGGENDGKDFLIYGYGHATVPVVTQKKK